MLAPAHGGKRARMNQAIGRITRDRLALLLTAAVLAGLLMYVVAGTVRKQDRWVRHELMVELSTERLLSTLIDAETGQRGYLLTNEEPYLDPYQNAIGRVQREIADLRELTVADPIEKDRLNEIEQLAKSKLNEIQRTIELRRGSGFQAAVDVVRTGEGRRAMDSIRAVARGMLRDEDLVLKNREQVLAAAIRRLTWFLGLGYLLIVVVTVSLYRQVQRHSLQAEKAEQKLSRLNAELEERIDERTSSLRESEERLRLAQDAAHVGSWDWDRATDQISGSKEFSEFYELAPGQSVAFSEILHRVHPEDRAAVRQASKNLSLNPAGTEVEFRVRHADGSTRWHLAKGALFKGAHGRPDRAFGVSIDITERKEAEAKLRANEELLRTFVTHVPVAVAMLDRDMRYLQVSDCWRQHHSLKSTEVLGRSHYEVFPNIPERWKKVHQRCLAGETAREDEDFLVREDNTPMWLRWEIRPWGAGPDGLLFFTEDISERKRMERQLRLRSDALESALMAFCIISMDGTFAYANRTCLEMWGYESLDEIVGKPSRAHIEFEAGQEIVREIERCGRCTRELVARRKDGSRFYALASVQKSTDETGASIYICTAIDITSRKRAEEALKQGEATIRTLLETASQAILAVDSAGHICLANQMSEMMFGYQREELLGSPIEMLVPVPLHELHKEHRVAFNTAPPNRLIGIGMDVQGCRKNGSEFPIEVSLSHIQTNDGLLAVSFITDITERKRAETALRNSERQLRALAGNLLTAQEDERRRIARDLHDDVTQQLAHVSIEIGKLAAAVPDSFKEGQNRLRSLQGRVNNVADEIRHVSHALHPSILEDLGLGAALEVFCEEFARAENIQVFFQGPPEETGLTLGAAAALYRVAQESLRNAAKHAHASQIRVLLGKSVRNIRLIVRDDGIGLPADSGRAHAGLGLVSMKERMRLVKGTLSVVSRQGGGTEVSACVPLEETSSAN